MFPKFSDMYLFECISFNSHSKFNADNKLEQSVFDRNMIYKASTIKNILHSKLSPSKKRTLIAYYQHGIPLRWDDKLAGEYLQSLRRRLHLLFKDP